jgi:CDP-glucose 4,6-dehydratase
VTTDKVYVNDERGRPCRETDHLGGNDPYAASKAACEIVTAALSRTYFAPNGGRHGAGRQRHWRR